jgi:antitoxin HicB
MARKHKNIGMSLDQFLEEEGLIEEVDALVPKRAIAIGLKEAMRAKKVSESVLARRMKTNRGTVRKLLDPNNDSATLKTIARAARAVGATFDVSFSLPGRSLKKISRKSKDRLSG